MDSSPHTPPDAPQHPKYTVSIWETIAITAGAVLLVAIGLAGLGVKALNNAFDPRRAQATAQSIANYQIPGGAQGVFGTNLGGGKLAVIGSLRRVQSAAQSPAVQSTVPSEVPSAGAVSTASDRANPANSSVLSSNASSTETVAPAETELFLARIPITEGATDPSSEEDITINNSFFLSGFSFSYQDSSDFQIHSTRVENRVLCGTRVPVTIQTGSLIVAEGSPPIPAVRYQAETRFKEHTFVAIVSALGDRAENLAVQVFDSLGCR
ncbi:hypothetical protein [Leptolyngbya ohadii]|uniref:hypothetical protein n=1 Tax=Leptolyngbya ohadii TaxID=1962290 RepID=UPI000B59854E|nr:hypothetical protein [Leptolyngbya ohadii]